MISVLFISLAAIFNAFMDAFENENFYESIFRDKNPRFWYKRESWKYARRIFGWKFDSWHVSKTAMVVCLSLAVVLPPGYQPIASRLIDFFIIGAAWNILFVLFYHKIFKVK